MYFPIISMNNIIKQNKKLFINTKDTIKGLDRKIYNNNKYIYHFGKIPQDKMHKNPSDLYIQVPGIWNKSNYHILKTICDMTPKCMAFDTNGRLYNIILTWDKHKDGGTFVIKKN